VPNLKKRVRCLTLRSTAIYCKFISIFGQTAAIDAHVGARIREFRTMLGLTQRQLGEMIGISDRQVHKYGARAQPGVGEFGV